MDAPDSPEFPAPPAPPVPRPPIASAPRAKSPARAAAITAALAATGLAVFWFVGSHASAPARSTAEALATSVKAVAARHPELKLETEPMSATELAGVEATGYVARGIWLLEPVGVSLGDRPLFRWLGGAGAGTYDVRVESDGAEVFRTTTSESSIAFPARREPLVVGTRYVVTVSAGEAGSTADAPVGRAEFTVLPVPHRASWRTLVGDVESNEPATIRDLLLAHLATRRHLFGEALRRTDIWSSAHPGDATARPLLEALARVFSLGNAPAPLAGFAHR